MPRPSVNQPQTGASRSRRQAVAEQGYSFRNRAKADLRAAAEDGAPGLIERQPLFGRHRDQLEGAPMHRRVVSG